MPVISMLILALTSLQLYESLRRVFVEFIDLSVCTAHLMLGFFEPSYRRPALLIEELS